MKDIGKLVIAIVLCEAVGIIGTLFTLTAIPTWYAGLAKPFFSPPNWLFGTVWTTLYLLMGISLFLVWQKGYKKKKVTVALKYFFIQLFLNLLWTPLFFGLRNPLLGLCDIILLLIMIISTMKHFYSLSKVAFSLFIPYVLWVSFAMALNFAIFVLNR